MSVSHIYRIILTLALLAGALAPASPSRAAPSVPQTYFVDSGNASTDGLVGFGRFDDMDIVHVLRDGIDNPVSTGTGSGVSFSATTPPAITRFNPRSLNIPAAGNYIEIANHVALNSMGNSFTVAAWIKRATLNTGVTIYDSGTQSNHWFVGLLSNNKLVFTKDSLADFASSIHTINDTNWHHVAYVVSSSNVTMYLDGTADTPQAIGSLTPPSGVKLIGNKQSKTTGFRGLIDELRLYNRALSATEISRLAQGKGCTQDGLSWDNAFNHLQCALDTAVSGDQVWVTRGLYRPGPAPAATFAGKSGVKLYGGFLGSEISLGERPAFTLPTSVSPSFFDYTILSGDVNGNDNPLTFANYTENNRFVVTNLSVNSAGRWDGFVIRGGSSNFPAPSAPDVEPEAGGGMFNFNSAVTLTNLAFLANQGNRSNHGGGLTNVNSNISLSASLFLGNRGYAGGMYTTGLTPNLSLMRFESNQGATAGGAVNADTGGLNLSYSAIIGNTSAGTGGGVSSENGTLSLYAVDMTGNTASLGGGAYISGTVATLTEIDLTGNTATTGNGGGGLAAYKGSFSMTDSRFQENRATNGFGGGLLIDGATAFIDRSRLFGNSAAAGGGAISTINTNDAKVFNTVLVGNGGPLNQTGNAINVGTANLKFVNCSFASNLNSSSAFLGRVSFNGVLTIVNSILWDHGSTLVEMVNPATSIMTANTVGRPGFGTDPKFTRYPAPGDGDWNTPGGNDYGDLHLMPFSTAIDAGSNALVQAGITLDLDFQPRFFDVPFVANTGAGTPNIDTGAYEAQYSKQTFLPVINRP